MKGVKISRHQLPHALLSSSSLDPGLLVLLMITVEKQKNQLNILYSAAVATESVVMFSPGIFSLHSNLIFYYRLSSINKGDESRVRKELQLTGLQSFTVCGQSTPAFESCQLLLLTELNATGLLIGAARNSGKVYFKNTTPPCGGNNIPGKSCRDFLIISPCMALSMILKDTSETLLCFSDPHLGQQVKSVTNALRVSCSMKVKDITLTTGRKDIATKCLTVRYRHGRKKRQRTIPGYYKVGHFASSSMCIVFPKEKHQKYRYQDEDAPHDHSLPRLTHEVRGPELVHVSEKNLSQIENVHGYVLQSHISPLKAQNLGERKYHYYGDLISSLNILTSTASESYCISQYLADVIIGEFELKNFPKIPTVLGCAEISEPSWEVDCAAASPRIPSVGSAMFASIWYAKKLGRRFVHNARKAKSEKTPVKYHCGPSSSIYSMSCCPHFMSADPGRGVMIMGSSTPSHVLAVGLPCPSCGSLSKMLKELVNKAQHRPYLAIHILMRELEYFSFSE
ncbi:hypothetical protein E5288_WYG019792 [Bos mutus]|uniref:Disks large homologue 1 N-terminal PEST domain-containing protein n=1 Tax=Bos mutus TaxID=72004 RepID=A0A6B0RUX2_9CETA|nr:hypothetical protein [Bos mutus]